MQKRTFIWALVLFLALALVVTGCAKQEPPQNEQSQGESNQDGEPAGDGSWERIQKAGKIVVGLDDGYPPMGFRNEKGELVGFDIDMVMKSVDDLCRNGMDALRVEFIVPLYWPRGSM